MPKTLQSRQKYINIYTMLVLRRITEENLEINTEIGDEYVLVLKEKHKEEFERQTESWTKENLKDIYGLILFNCSESIMPLYSQSNYYVMTGDGKTFSNISKKQD